MRFIVAILFIFTFVFAELPEAQYKLKTKKITNSACRYFEKDTVCYKISLKYPSLDIIKDNIAKILHYNIEKAKKEIFDENPKDFLKDISENDIISDGEWFNEASLELFDYYKEFTTISIFYSNYTGGVHPNSSLQLLVYQGNNFKNITIEDIIGGGDKNRFIDTAEKAYKIFRGLLPNESLTKDDWFENVFELSTSFAITDNGLLFTYSPYEVKPYASGYTYFILPYYMLKGVVGRESVIYDIVKDSDNTPKPKKLNLTLNNSGEFKAKLTALGNREIQLNIDTNLYNNYRYVWLSIGLPQYRGGRGISLVRYSGLDKFSLYPAGSRIYDNITHRVMRSKYLLVEGEKRGYSSMDNMNASLILKAPKGVESLCVELRVTAKNRKVVELTDSPFEDQQGFHSIRLCIPVK